MSEKFPELSELAEILSERVRSQKHVRSLLEKLSPAILSVQEYQDIYDALFVAFVPASSVMGEAKQLSCKLLTLMFNLQVLMAYQRPKFNEAEIHVKREIVTEVNAFARHNEITIIYENQPVILVVTTTRDGAGRYAYENKETKKRKGGYASLKALYPLQFGNPKIDWIYPETHHLEYNAPDQEEQKREIG